MFGFNTAVKGLLASQRSLYIVNHNISNINTKGYSRQQGVQRATTPFHMTGVGMLGTGTTIEDIIRMRDSYIDFKYWNENAPKGEWIVKRDGLEELEKLFGEPSDNSFRKYLDDFYLALDNMSKNPSDMSFREPVKENVLALTRHINETAKRLQDMKKEQEFSMETMERRINDLAIQITSLNKQIYATELDGRKANDLRDRRELLIDELSEIVDIRADESTDGKYVVSIGGVSLVDHTNTFKVKLAEDFSELQWSNGSKVSLRSGQLKGLLDIYNGDGVNNSYRGIPYYMDRLNQFAREFAESFNNQHKEGYTLDGEQGEDFFVFSEEAEIEDSWAATITLHDDILRDLRNIAAAGDKAGDAEDAKNLLKLIALRDEKSPDDFIKSILSNLAVDSLQGRRMSETQDVVLRNIQSKRDSIQGVSYDEEMADMVRFQHSYVASARMISTMDIIMDVTINRLGLVGR
ncbi:MAG TPA: flagellar hook-associated protein FlgK [Tepidimicrobium sp.]|nr:flagellar hook-associated protein FlgK [Tepidimicrobium sp.]